MWETDGIAQEEKICRELLESAVHFVFHVPDTVISGSMHECLCSELHGNSTLPTPQTVGSIFSVKTLTKFFYRLERS